MTKQIILNIDAAVLEHAQHVSDTDGKSLNKLVEEFLQSLYAAPGKKESVVDRIVERLKGKIQIPVPEDYKRFIREERYKDMLSRQNQPGE